MISSLLPSCGYKTPIAYFILFKHRVSTILKMSSQPVSIHLLCQLIRDSGIRSELISVETLVVVNRTYVPRSVLNNLDEEWTKSRWDLYMTKEHTEQVIDPPRLWNLLQRWVKETHDQHTGYTLVLDCANVSLTPQSVSTLLNSAISSYVDKSPGDADIEFLQKAYVWFAAPDRVDRQISREAKGIVSNLIGAFYGKEKKAQRTKISQLRNELEEAQKELARLESETGYWKAKLFSK